MAFDFMYFNDLVLNWNEYQREYPNQRSGQAAFNSVYNMEPDIANMLRATDVDPFYRDEKLPEFWNSVYKLLYDLD